MAKTKKQVSHKGRVDIDRDILLSIINLAAKEINGVESLTNGYLPWYKKIVRPKSEGVSIKFDANSTLKVDVYLKVNIGYSVPDVAYKVQENIKNSLTQWLA